jgi:hypothetical protein
MSDNIHRAGRWIFYAGFIALVVLAFLAQILQGECPV